MKVTEELDHSSKEYEKLITHTHAHARVQATWKNSRTPQKDRSPHFRQSEAEESKLNGPDQISSHREHIVLYQKFILVSKIGASLK